MQTVLGLAVTSSRVGWVVLDGSGAGTATLDHDIVDVAGRPADDISRHIGAVRGARVIAAVGGQDLTSIGVAWSDEDAATANLVLRTLPGLGFDKVVPVHLADLGDDIELTARAAALAVVSGVDTVPMPLLRREAVVAVPTRKHSWVAPARAAVILVAGLSALFVAGPEFAGQPVSPTPETQTASDSSAGWQSVYAVTAPAAPSPPPVTVRLVAGRAAPPPVGEAAPVVAEVVVPETPTSAEPVSVPHMPAQQVAASSTVDAPAPATPASTPVEAPPDPALLVFSPLFSALP